MGAASSPTGGFGASVPMSLPTPPSGLPVPVSIQYSGPARDGDAGVGWEVPLSYVRLQTSTWRRKPSLTSANNDASAARVFVSLNGASTLMVPHGGVRIPYAGSQYMELSREGLGWTLRTLDNLEYRFMPAALLVGNPAAYPDLWLLTSISDPSKADAVRLTYDFGGGEVNLASVAHTYNAKDPLYEIHLRREPFIAAGHPWGIVSDDGVMFQRRNVLKHVEVRARENHLPTSSPKVIRAYHLSYSNDADTDKPRLLGVTTTGEAGVAGPELPVAEYAYEGMTITDQGQPAVRFSAFEPVQRSVAGTAYADDLATTSTTIETLAPDPNSPLDYGHFFGYRLHRETSRARHVIRDFTGDGLPDLVFKDGSTWKLVKNRLGPNGPDLSGPPTSSWSAPAELHVETTVRFNGRAIAEQRWARKAMITTETWVDFIDWNGDGRLDIVDATAGDEETAWRVWLNQDDGNGGVSWAAFEVDVSNMTAYLESKGFEQRPVNQGYFPGYEWYTHWPLSRSRSWPRVHTWACSQWNCATAIDGTYSCSVEPPCGPPAGWDDPGVPVPVDTMKEWSILDANGDAFPDLVTATDPVRQCEKDIRAPHAWDLAACAYDPPQSPDGAYGMGAEGPHACGVEHREWIFAGIPAIPWSGTEGEGACGEGPADESQIAVFLNRHGAYVGASGSPFPAVPTEDTRSYPAGVEHWTTGTYDPFERVTGAASGRSWQSMGWADPEADGVPTPVTRQTVSGSPTFRTDRHERCAHDNTTHPIPYQAWQSSGLFDLNGDGRADYVYSEGDLEPGQGRSWFVQFHNGVYFGARRRLLFPDFALSDAHGDCVDEAQTVAGLTDLDGDGLPEVLRIINGVLHRSSMLARGPSRLAIGRLTAIHNGQGAATEIRYANAKADQSTAHAVPFPEIVVAEVSTALDGGTALPTTVHGYGDASLSYEPVIGQWSFRGYRRQFSITGTKGADGAVDGILTTTQRGAAAPAGSTWTEHVLAEQTTRTQTAEGTFGPADHSTILQGVISPIAEVHASYRALQIAPSVYEPAPLDCADLDPVTARPNGTARCTGAGVVYAAWTQSWEGNSAPPALDNVLVGSTVDGVDGFGRPVRMMYAGDLRRTDDDVCTVLEYATPPNGGAFPSVPAQLVVTDCGWGAAVGGIPGAPRTLSSSRFYYDELLLGEVALGRLTSREVDRFDATGYRETIVADRMTYDGRGMLATVERGGHNGAATRLVTLTRDAFGATVVRAEESASDVSEAVTVDMRVSSWPSVPSTSADQHGVISTVTHDGFGRKTREYVTHGTRKTLLKRFKYDDSPGERAVTVEVFPGDTQVSDELTSTDKQVGRIVLDGLGRPRFSELQLGADYGSRLLVDGFVRYDELGRVVFAAAPFSAAGPSFIPDPQAQRYGSSFVYDRRGRVVREVSAYGYDPNATETAVPDGTFVASYEYDYLAGLAVTSTRGRDENDPSSAHFGFVDEARRTATGRELMRTRRDGARNRLDVVTQEWDRLGRMTHLRRYLQPMTFSGVVEWRTEFDSLGRRLASTEPGMATVHSEYDGAGNPVESWWIDGGAQRIQRVAYDGFGRQTDRWLITDEAGVADVEAHDVFHYDRHSGHSQQPVGSFGGRLSWVETVGVGAVYYGYDDLGRASSTTYLYSGHGGVVRQTSRHTGGGRLEALTLTTPDTVDVIDYDYDSAERLRVVLREGVPLVEAGDVDDKGRYLKLAYGNGAVESFEYSPFAREELRTWTTSTAGGDYVFENLELDGAGRMKWERQTTPSGSILFGYDHDGLGRLKGVARSTSGIPEVETYSHDPLGNLVLRQATSAPGDLAYYYDGVDRDRLCRAVTPGTTAPCQFTYDAVGNVTSDLSGATQRKFDYDAGQRIEAIVRGTNLVEFEYGPLGRAHTRVTTSDEAREVWHFGLIEERRSVTAKYIERRIPGPLGANISLRSHFADDAVVAESVVYAHGDGRGERVFTGNNAAVVQSATYGTFGATSTTGTGAALTQSDDLWNGGDNFPEVGVVILGPRAYDPALGRFLQRDPFSVTARSSTANPYAFAFSNPVDFGDPTGLWPSLTIFKQTGGAQPAGIGDGMPGWAKGLALGIASAAALGAFSTDQAADPWAGVGATGHRSWFGQGGILGFGEMGGPCDNAFCSAFDGAISGFGDALMQTYGAYTRGKLEALGEIGLEGLKRSAAAGVGGLLGIVAYDGYQATELVRSAPGMAAAVAADPKIILCEGDGCGIDDYGRFEANMSAAAAGPKTPAAAAALLQKGLGFRIAFGLGQHPLHNYSGLLWRFANKVHAKTYWHLYDDADDIHILEQRLNTLMQDAGSIHFNLDGMLQGPRYRTYAEILAAGRKISFGNITNWEFFRVTSFYMSKANFYLDGKRVDPRTLGISQ